MEFIMMCGLPGSGKTSWARETNYKVISSDSIREELYGDESIQGDAQKVFEILHSRVKESLKNGESCVYDATNLNWKLRRSFLNEISSIKCKKTCVLMADTFAECYDYNTQRERKVPIAVMRRMYHNFCFPSTMEGFDEVKLVWGNFMNDSQLSYFYDLDKEIERYKNYDQCNRHHALTLGQHLEKCARILEDNHRDYNLVMAGLLHDIGKPEVRTFMNARCQPTEEAHYYNHNNVSSYEAMFFLKKKGMNDEDIKDVCNLVFWHMQPYFIEKEKTKNRYLKFWGEDFYNRVYALHKADMEAH